MSKFLGLDSQTYNSALVQSMLQDQIYEYKQPQSKNIPKNVWNKLSRSEIDEFLLANRWLDPIMNPYDTARLLYNNFEKLTSVPQMPGLMPALPPVPGIPAVPPVPAILPTFPRKQLKLTTTILDLELSTTIKSKHKYSIHKIIHMADTNPKEFKDFADNFKIYSTDAKQLKERVIRILRFAELLEEPEPFDYKQIPTDIYDMVAVFIHPSDISNYLDALNITDKNEQDKHWANKLEHDFGINGRLAYRIGSKQQYLKYAKAVGYTHLDYSYNNNNNNNEEFYTPWASLISIINTAKSGNFYSAMIQAVKVDPIRSIDNIDYPVLRNITLPYILYYIGMAMYYNITTYKLPTLDLDDNYPIIDFFDQHATPKYPEIITTINSNYLNYLVNNLNETYPEYIVQQIINPRETAYLEDLIITDNVQDIAHMGLIIGTLVNTKVTQPLQPNNTPYYFTVAIYMAEIILDRPNLFKSLYENGIIIDNDQLLLFIVYAAIFESINVMKILLLSNQIHREFNDQIHKLAYVANCGGPKIISYVFSLAVKDNNGLNFITYMLNKFDSNHSYVLYKTIIENIGLYSWDKDNTTNISNLLFSIFNRQLVNTDGTLDVAQYEITLAIQHTLNTLGFTNSEIAKKIETFKNTNA